MGHAGQLGQLNDGNSGPHRRLQLRTLIQHGILKGSSMWSTGERVLDNKPRRLQFKVQFCDLWQISLGLWASVS